MTTRNKLFLALAASVACSSESPTISSPEGNGVQPKFSDIRVSIDISGVPSTGLEHYDVFVDGFNLAKVKPGSDAIIQLGYGQHTFALQHASIFEWAWWCTYRGAESFTVTNDESHSPSVTFRLDCPALDGAGKANLSFYEPSISTKENLGVTLTRLNGPPYSLFFTATPEIQNEVQVPSGLYRVSASSPRCNLSYLYLEFDLSRVVVRANQTSSYTVSMDCR